MKETNERVEVSERSGGETWAETASLGTERVNGFTWYFRRIAICTWLCIGFGKERWVRH